MSTDKTMADNDSIEYKLMTAEHVEGAADVISEAFIHGELLNLALDMPFKEQLQKNREVCQLALADGVSVVAIDKKTNNIVGAAVGSIITGANHLASAKNINTPAVNDESCPYAKRIVPFLQELDKFYHLHPKLIQGNLDKDCNISKSFKIGVLPSYSGRGIGKKLVDLRNEYACKKGCRFIFLMTTSPVSEKLYLKLGYEVIGEVPYKDFEVGDEKPFSCITTSYSAKAMLKCLDP